MQARSLVKALLAAILASACTTLASSAQETAPKDAYTESFDVTVMNLDVRVLNNKGESIKGLVQEDFQLFENDKQKLPLTNFYEVSTTTAKDPVSLVFYFDESNLRAPNRDRALEELRADLSAFYGGSPVRTMVVRHDSSYNIVQGFTTSQAEVDAALNSMIGTESIGTARFDTLIRASNQTFSDLVMQTRSRNREDRMMALSSIDGVLGELRNFGKQMHDGAIDTVDQLRHFVRTLASVPGRKVVVYVSDGLPVRPLGEAFKVIQDIMTGSPTRVDDTVGSTGGGAGEGIEGLGDGAVFQRDVTMELGRTQQASEPFNATEEIAAFAAEANAYRVTFYPLMAPPGDASGRDSGQRKAKGELEVSDMREALELIGRETGGEARTSGTSAEGYLAEIRSDLDHYYSLGFSVEGKPIGQTIPLQLKVKQRGARLLYPTSYVPKDFVTRLADRTMAAVLLGATDNPHEIETKVESEAPLEGDLVQLDVAVEFPIRTIGLELADGIHRGRMRLSVVVLDAASEVLVGKHLQMPIEVGADALEDALQQFYRVVIQLPVPPGDHRLGLGLWDGVSSIGSFVEQPLVVGTNQ